MKIYEFSINQHPVYNMNIHEVLKNIMNWVFIIIHVHDYENSIHDVYENSMNVHIIHTMLICGGHPV